MTELHRAGADPARLLVVEASQRFPNTRGLPPEHLHALHVDEIDVLVESEPRRWPARPAADGGGPRDRRARRALHPGRGDAPDRYRLDPLDARPVLAEGDGGGYGVHSEMFTTGLMRLHQAGKVANEKGQFDGVSVTTFAFGTEELYEWLDGNQDVAFLPVDVVNNPDVIARNRGIVTINGALAIDIHGQVVADMLQGRQFSGIGGHEDFVAGPGLSLDDRSLLCLPSTVDRRRRACAAGSCRGSTPAP